LPGAEHPQDEVILAEDLIEDTPVSDSNVELPVGCLLLGSWQPCPAIGELKTVIEILLRMRKRPVQPLHIHDFVSCLT